MRTTLCEWPHGLDAARERYRLDLHRLGWPQLRVPRYTTGLHEIPVSRRVYGRVLVIDTWLDVRMDAGAFVWFMNTGEWPPHGVGQGNRNPRDVRFSNLIRYTVDDLV